MDGNIVWLWLSILLVGCPNLEGFNIQDNEGSARADWLSQSELANSVPRIGRRSFTPKLRQNGFRFYGGESPYGISSSSKYGYGDNLSDLPASKWQGLWGSMFGSLGNDAGFRFDSDDVDSEGQFSGKFRDKRDKEVEKRDPVAEVPSSPGPNAFNQLLSDDNYWNDFLNGARKTVYDKLASMNKEQENEVEEAVADVAEPDPDPVPASSPVARFFSRYPVEPKSAAKAETKPLSRSEILSKMSGFRGFVRNNL